MRPNAPKQTKATRCERKKKNTESSQSNRWKKEEKSRSGSRPWIFISKQLIYSLGCSLSHRCIDCCFRYRPENSKRTNETSMNYPSLHSHSSFVCRFACLFLFCIENAGRQIERWLYKRRPRVEQQKFYIHWCGGFSHTRATPHSHISAFSRPSIFISFKFWNPKIHWASSYCSPLACASFSIEFSAGRFSVPFFFSLEIIGNMSAHCEWVALLPVTETTERANVRMYLSWDDECVRDDRRHNGSAQQRARGYISKLMLYDMNEKTTLSRKQTERTKERRRELFIEHMNWERYSRAKTVHMLCALQRTLLASATRKTNENCSTSARQKQSTMEI